MNDLLSAIYETKRQSFLLGYIQYPEKFDDALAYAYYHRLSPTLHASSDKQDPFEEVYDVSSEFISEVLKYVDEKWLARDLDSMGFYDLEEKFGGYKTNRMELKFALEYMRIDRRFDESVWEAIEENAPMEANSLMSSFSPDNVSFN